LTFYLGIGLMMATMTTAKASALLIGQVAERAGVNVQTLRYYEKRGILGRPVRTAAGYRRYPAETVRIIRFIKRAQDLGFTLDEIEDLLRLRTMKGIDKSKVRDTAAAKVSEIDEKLRRLGAVRNALAQLVDTCTCQLGVVPCPILEALEEPGDVVAMQSNEKH
jgi:MerR family transcriptional regulator, mercuric resistance operon regulatory protein